MGGFATLPRNLALTITVHASETAFPGPGV
jgi:hypothetical protein